MSYDPTQQVPPTQGYPTQPGYIQNYPPQAYPPPQAAYPPGYLPPQATPVSPIPQYPVVPPGIVPGTTSPGIWQSLGMSGQAAAVIGVLTLILFFLPWYTAPDPNGTYSISGIVSQAPTYSISNTATYPGVSAAIGITDPQFGKVANQTNGTLNFTSNGSTTITLSLSLWLVPLGALALLGVAWYLSQRRISSRAAALALIAISAVSLVMELSFVVAITSLESDVEHTYAAGGGHLVSTFYAVSWGAWLALVVTAVGLVAGIFAQMQARKALAPAAAVAQPFGVQ